MLPVYREKNTLVHRLHPLTALLLSLTPAILALILENPLYLPLLCIGLLGLIGVSEVWDECRSFLRLGLIMAMFILLINPLVNRQGEHILVYGPHLPFWGNINVTLEALLYGLFAGLRVFVIVAACGFLSTTVSPDDLLDLLARFSLRSSLAMALAVRLYPGMVVEAERIKEVQLARGERLNEGKYWQRFKAHLPLWYSLFQSSLDRAANIAEAMSARGFGRGKRNVYKKKSFQPRDAIVALPMTIVLAGTIAASTAGLGSYSFFPSLALPWNMWSPFFLGLIAWGNLTVILLIWSWKRWHWLRSKI